MHADVHVLCLIDRPAALVRDSERGSLIHRQCHALRRVAFQWPTCWELREEALHCVSVLALHDTTHTREHADIR